jgi:hypothetical protein
MKLLLLAILATSITANATGNTPQGSTTNNFLNQIQGQHQTQESASNAQGGSSSVNYDNDTKMPASSAVAPSVSSFVKCPIATQESKAFSVLIFSASGTTGVSFHGLCYAIERGDWETATKMMCDADKEYAKANAKCGTK